MPMRLLMSRRLRASTAGEQGFTLIELLVVILIIGILAAIAIAAFLAQQGKAYDALAKEVARSGLQASETYATDHNGEYTGVSPTILNEYEPAIQIAPGKNNAYLSVATALESGRGFEVTAVAPGPGGDTFTIVRKASGEVLRTCTLGSTNKSGCAAGTW